MDIIHIMDTDTKPKQLLINRQIQNFKFRATQRELLQRQRMHDVSVFHLNVNVNRCEFSRVRAQGLGKSLTLIEMSLNVLELDYGRPIYFSMESNHHLSVFENEMACFCTTITACIIGNTRRRSFGLVSLGGVEGRGPMIESKFLDFACISSL